MKQVYKKESWFQVFNKDARDLAEVEDNSISLVVTSPPYFVGKSYESYLKTIDDYLNMLGSVWEQVSLKLKSGGRLVVNIAHSPKSDTPSLISTQLFQLGWTFQDNIIWQKTMSVSPRFGSFVQNPYATYYVPNTIYEHLLVFSKGVPCKERKTAVDIEWAKTYRNDVWLIRPENNRKLHEAPYPVALVEPLVLLYSSEGDTILDPFIGSGTTAIACLKNKRNCIGYELSREYCEVAIQRVTDEV